MISGCCSGGQCCTVANLRRLNFNFTSQCKTRVKNNITAHVRPMLWTTRQSLPALFGCQYNNMRLDSAKIQSSACSFRWNFAKVIYWDISASPHKFKGLFQCSGVGLYIMFKNIFRKTMRACVYHAEFKESHGIFYAFFTQADMQSLVSVTTDRILRVLTGPNEALNK